MTRLRCILFCIFLLALTGCASQPGLSEELDRSVKTYNRMLRWQELESAVTTYTDQEKREECLKQAASLKKRGLSVTDFRILSSRYLPENKTGDVITEFDYYILPSNRIKTIANRQEWVYRDLIKKWQLNSWLPPFE